MANPVSTVHLIRKISTKYIPSLIISVPLIETTCVDDKGEDFCKKNVKKCKKQSIQEKCKKTCGVCPTPTQDDGE